MSLEDEIKNFEKDLVDTSEDLKKDLKDASKDVLEALGDALDKLQKGAQWVAKEASSLRSYIEERVKKENSDVDQNSDSD